MKNYTLCDSSLAGRLDIGLQVYQITYSTLFFTAICFSLKIWHKKKWHPALSDKPFHMFVLQSIFFCSYLLFSFLFILNTPSPLTTCSSTTVLFFLVHCVSAPTAAALLSAIYKSKHNDKLLIYFSRNKLLTAQGLTHIYDSDSHESNDEKLLLQIRNLKYKVSSKFHSLVVLVLCTADILLAIFLQGWFGREKCGFETDLIETLAVSTCLVALLFMFLIILIKKKHNKYIERKHNRKFLYRLFLFGVLPIFISSAVIVIDSRFFSANTESVNFIPHFMLDASFFALYILLGPYFIYKTFDGSVRSMQSNTEGINLTEVLQHKTAREMFQAFLVSNYSSENLAFVSHIERMKNMSIEELEEAAKLVYKTFIKVGAVAEVNISYSARMTAENRFKLSKYSKDMYQEAFEEVMTLLEHESFPKFQASDYYKEIFISGYEVSL
eukprot:snap_masked-scaffold_40-processed-gene-1.17-mRNA-1 protein AED:1.00 eAED:1.00 QI:0/0/0/0/1/1/2/0/439